MTKFLDGPAAARSLMLRRAPMFLRVTDDGEKIDALDQLEDTPRANETLYCYVMSEYRGGIHLLIRGKNRAAGGFYMSADYTFVIPQPPDEEMRTNHRWRAWTEANSNLIPDAIRNRTTAVLHKKK